MDRAAFFSGLFAYRPSGAEHSAPPLRSPTKLPSFQVKAAPRRQPKSEGSVLDQFRAIRSLMVPMTINSHLTPVTRHAVGVQLGLVVRRGGSSTVRARRDPVAPFIRAVENLGNLNCPCVLRIFQWAFSPFGPPHRSEDDICVEIAPGGSVRAVLERATSGPESASWRSTEIACIPCGIALGLRFVHSHGFFHGNLKPESILLGRTGRP
jgi:serine/threonine protein kinase